MSKRAAWGMFALLLATTTACSDNQSARPEPSTITSSESSEEPTPSKTAADEPVALPTNSEGIAALLLQNARDKATDTQAFDRGKVVGVLELTVKGGEGSAEDICAASEHREDSEDWMSGCTTAITFTRLTDPEYSDF
ncbi:hypothetical protein MTQ10_23310 [Streptomyces sp. XM83C]|uniref:hypothetical protein n=1 Tax=Streptomyces sp. XM83C TaxID=2929781 RepID=UPI001FF82234|nr:hypothetical protein [Streptomyces sp. XM83C]MCK1822459.1 hypothetical protein [Streptomyces sp. XM83C]